MMLDEETLMAYVDGEHERAAEIERALATRPMLAARVKEMRALRKEVADAFAPIAAERPPTYLTALLFTPHVAPVVMKRAVFGLGAFAAAAAIALIALVASGKIGSASKPQSSVASNDDRMLGPNLLPPFVTLTPRGAVIAPSIAPPVQSAPPRVVFADAVWLLRPDAETIERYYPERAAAQNIQGKVVLSCSVKTDGWVVCGINNEYPQGWGFAAAAMKVARHFRLAMNAANGMRAAGGRITIPILFAPRNCVAVPSPITLSTPASTLRTTGGGFGGTTPPPEPDSTPLPTGPRFIQKPVWVQKPTAKDMAAIYFRYAARAMEWGVRGHVVVRCVVALDGALTNCAIASEAPTQWGFGNVALKVVQQFRMAPQNANGEPTAGALVDVPIAFRRGN